MAAPAGVNESTPGEPAENAAALPGDEETPAVVAAAADGAATGERAAEDMPAEPGMLAEPAPVLEGTAEAELAGAELPEGADDARDMPGEPWAGRDVSPLAVAGIIFGVIALVAVAAGVLAIITHGFKPKTVVTYRTAAVFKLQPGQCINIGSSAMTDTVVSCSAPHDAEVFASFQLTGSWPGSAGVTREASNGCASRFSSYLNPQLATAALDQQFVYPDEQAWHADERTVVCEVSSSDGKLTGSVRNGVSGA